MLKYGLNVIMHDRRDIFEPSHIAHTPNFVEKNKNRFIVGYILEHSAGKKLPKNNEIYARTEEKNRYGKQMEPSPETNIEK